MFHLSDLSARCSETRKSRGARLTLTIGTTHCILLEELILSCQSILLAQKILTPGVKELGLNKKNSGGLVTHRAA